MSTDDGPDGFEQWAARERASARDRAHQARTAYAHWLQAQGHDPDVADDLAALAAQVDEVDEAATEEWIGGFSDMHAHGVRPAPDWSADGPLIDPRGEG